MLMPIVSIRLAKMSCALIRYCVCAFHDVSAKKFPVGITYYCYFITEDTDPAVGTWSFNSCFIIYEIN